MAFDAGTVKGSIDLDAAKFIAEMKKVERRLDAVEKEAKETESGFGKLGGKIAAIAAGVGAAVASFLALRAALRGLVTGLTRASADAAEFELTVQKLSVSLGQAGVRNVGAFVEEMKNFASETQKATAFSDGFILETAQLLTVLGVSKDKLADYTKAVLDYAAATGQDAVNAARQFGKTFGGTLGELSESLPALKSLTEEQLKMGGAFEFAADAFGGFAEKIANTSAGLSDRLKNTVGDFSKNVGGLINPFLNELKKSAITVVEELGKIVDENRTQFAQLFKDFTLGILNAVPGAIDAITSLRVSFVEAASAFSKLGPGMVGTFSQLALSATEAHLAANKFFARLGDKSAQASLDTLRARVEKFRSVVDEAATEYGKITREAEASAEAAKKQADALKARLLPLLAKAKKTVEGISTEFAKGDDDASGLADSTKQASVWAAVLAKEAENAGAQLTAAAGAADDLSDATGEAADSLSAATGGGRDGAGRVGGAAGLDFSDPFSALSAVESARRTERQAAFSTFGFVRRAASNVATQVQAQAQATLDRTFSQFTDELVSELNRAGVFDPTERQSFIGDRIAEAQRLGVLPTTRSAASFGAVGSIA